MYSQGTFCATPDFHFFYWFSGPNVNFGTFFPLTLAHVGYFDTKSARRIEWDGPEIQLELWNSKLVYFGYPGIQFPGTGLPGGLLGVGVPPNWLFISLLPDQSFQKCSHGPYGPFEFSLSNQFRHVIFHRFPTFWVENRVFPGLCENELVIL